MLLGIYMLGSLIRKCFLFSSLLSCLDGLSLSLKQSWWGLMLLSI